MPTRLCANWRDCLTKTVRTACACARDKGDDFHGESEDLKKVLDSPDPPWKAVAFDLSWDDGKILRLSKKERVVHELLEYTYEYILVSVLKDQRPFKGHDYNGLSYQETWGRENKYSSTKSRSQVTFLKKIGLPVVLGLHAARELRGMNIILKEEKGTIF